MPDISALRRVLIISDAWHPQINGVVRTIAITARELEKQGVEVRVVGPEPETNLTFALPGYAEIRLEFFAARRIGKIITAFAPDIIHLATEGPLGWAARHVCLTRRLPFTTAYHTCFPEYVAARVAKIAWLPGFVVTLAKRFSYSLMRHFHAPSGAVLVATASIETLLRQNGFNPERLCRWSRGVDLAVFRPEARDPALFANLPQPIALYVGRVSIEKNIRAFLDITCPGRKVVVGGGPELSALMADYPQVRFVGEVRDPDKLAAYYASADLLVFPSKTDTFGLVLLEAMACGLPIAAYPSSGPQDIFAVAATHEFYRLDQNLTAAATVMLAAKPPPDVSRRFVAENFSWAACTQQFIQHSLGIPHPARRKLWRIILADSLVSLPGQVYNYTGLRQILWVGRRLWRFGAKIGPRVFGNRH
jgi:glycosyltransferase involved in cell wall biosynthesis